VGVELSVSDSALLSRQAKDHGACTRDHTSRDLNLLQKKRVCKNTKQKQVQCTNVTEKKSEKKSKSIILYPARGQI